MLYLRDLLLVVAPLSAASLTLSPGEAAAKAAWLAKMGKGTAGKVVPTGAHPVPAAKPYEAPGGATWQEAMAYEDRVIGYGGRGSSGSPTAYESGMMQPTTNWALQPFGVDKPSMAAPTGSAPAATPPTPAAPAQTAWQAAEAYENRVIGYGAHGSSGGPTAYESGMLQPTTNWALTPFGIDVGMGQPATTGAAGAVDYSTMPISQQDVLAAQDAWGRAIVTISQVHASGGDYVGAAGAAAGELYGYGHTEVLFKPTKAAEYPFRPTGNEAMSYFVGGDVVEGGYAEDHGFAINGGKGWQAVKFINHQIDLNADTAIAMGTYIFTCATTGADVNVEYTFGYKRNADGKLRVFLHHSSVPYGPH